MDIQDKLNRIIPPSEYKFRNGFSNHLLIDELNDKEKNEIENLLIKKLQDGSEDSLIFETLSYLNSKNAVSLMLKSLENCQNALQQIKIAISIYKINHDNKMVDFVSKAFNKLNNEYDLISSFSYLEEFKDRNINELIEKYTHNSDFLIAYNAKRVLGINTYWYVKAQSFNQLLKTIRGHLSK